MLSCLFRLLFMILLLVFFACLVTGDPQVGNGTHCSHAIRSSTSPPPFISMFPLTDCPQVESSLDCALPFNSLMNVDMERLLPELPKTSEDSALENMALVPTASR